MLGRRSRAPFRGKFLVAFRERVRPFYGCMNPKGRAVAVDGRGAPLSKGLAEVDRGSYRSQRVEDDTVRQVGRFIPGAGAS